MIAYHIDRSGTLKEGMLLEFDTELANKQDDHLKFIANEMFSDGISYHGAHYLSDTVYQYQGKLLEEEIVACNTTISTLITEYTFELIRQLHYPKIPSRMQSIFALPSLDNLSSWIELSRCHNIYEVEFDEKQNPTLDAQFLLGGLCINLKEKYQGFSPYLNWSNAHNYWSGNISEKPKLEILIKLPVVIGRKVDYPL